MITARSFILAGNATFTVRSRKTGARFTYKARQPKADSPVFISLLNGSDNEDDFTFLGTIFNGERYAHGRKSSVGADAPSAVAFNWLWNNIEKLPDTVEFFHEGCCACCGRKLTTPESIELGVGPECAKKM